MHPIKNEPLENSSTSLRQILQSVSKRPASHTEASGPSKVPRLDGSVKQSASTLPDYGEATVPFIKSEQTEPATARKDEHQGLWQENQRLDQENKRLDRELRNLKTQMNIMMASLRKDVAGDTQKQVRELRDEVNELRDDGMGKARDRKAETEVRDVLDSHACFSRKSQLINI